MSNAETRKGRKPRFRKGQLVWARGVVVEPHGEFCIDVAVIRFSPDKDELLELEGSAQCAQCAEVELVDLKRRGK